MLPLASLAQTKWEYVEMPTDSGCVFRDSVLPPNVQRFKDSEFEWKGGCKDGFLDGQGTLTVSYPDGTIWTVKGGFKAGMIDGQVLTTSIGKDFKRIFEGEYEKSFRTVGTLVVTSPTIDFVYMGQFKDDKYHGQGHVEDKKAKVIAEGMFENGIMVSGIVNYANGNIYEGTLKDKKPNGVGTTRFANGDFYEGSFIEGKPEGKGKYTAANGTIIVGFFKNNQADGLVSVTYKNGGKFDGMYVSGKANGKGKEVFANGEIYEGNYVDGKREGKGKLTSGRGDAYIGDFVGNQFEGQGIMTYADGAVYNGSWKSGRVDGIGILKSASGETYAGEFHSGKQDGSGLLTRKDGKKINVVYKDGVLISPAPQTATPQPNAPAGTATGAGSSIPALNLDDAKAKCISLGFKDKTEAFGKCVLQLSK